MPVSLGSEPASAWTMPSASAYRTCPVSAARAAIVPSAAPAGTSTRTADRPSTGLLPSALPTDSTTLAESPADTRPTLIHTGGAVSSARAAVGPRPATNAATRQEHRAFKELPPEDQRPR